MLLVGKQLVLLLFILDDIRWVFFEELVADHVVGVAVLPLAGLVLLALGVLPVLRSLALR